MKQLSHDYRLTCPRCGASYPDDGLLLHCAACSEEGERTILRYTPLQGAAIDGGEKGLLRFASFMPVRRLEYAAVDHVRTVRSEKLGAELGLDNLYLTVTGYCPTLGVDGVTCSFKELEAFVVINRLKSYGVDKPLVIASAGNTARAFAYYGAKLGYPVIIVTPLASREYMWLPDEEGLFEGVERYVTTVYVDYPAKYFHAGLLAKKLAATLGKDAVEEGGFFNVARLSGLGCCALDFVHEVGRVPDHYVQAVGSASGVLAAMRMFDLHTPGSHRDCAYHMVQNIPYTPLVESVEQKKRMFHMDYYANIDTVCSPMLTSGDPAYSYAGGLYDALESGVAMHGYGVSNNSIYEAQYHAWRDERLSLLLPAAASLVGLREAVASKRIARDDLVMVNLTGVGDVPCKADKGFFYVNSSLDAPVPEMACLTDAAFKQWFNQCRPDGKYA